jgi:uncharacterized repeat protein (TIGR01451 family)
VIQPTCQNLPDGSVVNNPAYVAQTSKSYWTYKFLTDCNSTTRAISNFGIPICESIAAGSLVVSEKIDGCGTFTPVPFTLTKDDPNLGPAPTGFQYVKVETGGRYEKGVSVEYRLEIVGDYPTAVEPIKVKAANVVLTFDCGCFLVPQCVPQGKLTMTKNCSETISNNQVTLNYNLTVSNIGEAPLQNVQFQDVITIPIQLTPGTITVTPATLSVDTSVPGQIKISGNLGTINQGGQVNITYTIPIAAVSQPGSYIVSNTALASATGTQTTATCSANIKVVQLATDKCCLITDGNKGNFRFTITSVGLSPDIMVNVFDDIFIPGGITIKFTSFDGCVATFANTTDPVPLNTDIVGPKRIRIDCNNLLIPAGNDAHKNITFMLVCSSAVGTAAIENAVESVTPVNPAGQVFLGAGTLPAQANIQVLLNMNCTKPCS